MKIRTRFTYLFTIIVASILLLFSISIFLFSSNYRSSDFQNRLKDRATTMIKLLIVVDEIDSLHLKIIDRNDANKLTAEGISIYNDNKICIFNTDKTPPYVPDNLFNELKVNNEKNYNNADTAYLGLRYDFKNKTFFVVASAYDKYGIAKIRNLKNILIAGILVCVIIIFFSGWFYSGRFLKPISNVVKQVDTITFSNIDQRLDEGNQKDEIGQLAITFNRMLARLNTSFNLQKKFVSNASHELRNPLTAINGQIDVALMKDRETEQYKNILASVSADIKKLRVLTNSLLELANSDVETLFQKFDEHRIDEILWDIRENILKQKPDYTIHIDFEKVADNEKSFTIKGNEKLLLTAIGNIIDNACKFSENKTVEIKVTFDDKNIILYFIDTGMGISENELSRIFEPFYRGSNAIGIAGHGIGLSLSEKIINIHSGELLVKSTLHKGTTVKVSLPNVS